ncbi:MAG: transcriptional regulator [Deltaproteobacteria bacterium]|nr:transcriptional regulator [Deltaproteobacteria bacterium]
MTSNEILLELYKKRKNGGNMAYIARNMDPSCSRQAVSGVVARSTASKRVAIAVSEAIGLPPRLVFPEYFRKKKKVDGQVCGAGC